MPYIEQKYRERVIKGEANNAGELNFQISQLVDAYIERTGVKYNTFNDVIGVLEALKLELYRRFVGPYEESKIDSNGDVFQIARRNDVYFL